MFEATYEQCQIEWRESRSLKTKEMGAALKHTQNNYSLALSIQPGRKGAPHCHAAAYCTYILPRKACNLGKCEVWETILVLRLSKHVTERSTMWIKKVILEL